MHLAYERHRSHDGVPWREGEAMRQFDLPLVAYDTSAESALMTAIDAKRFGVVLKTESGGLQLIDYDSLISAVDHNRSISPSDYIPILNIGNDTLEVVRDTVDAAGFKFGYLSETADFATLLSVHEFFAERYLTSAGVRCDRPPDERPAGTSDHDWYHYFPPFKRDSADLHRCTECGSPLP
jgi:hypothetical protein